MVWLLASPNHDLGFLMCVCLFLQVVLPPALILSHGCFKFRILGFGSVKISDFAWCVCGSVIVCVCVCVCQQHKLDFKDSFRGGVLLINTELILDKLVKQIQQFIYQTNTAAYVYINATTNVKTVVYHNTYKDSRPYKRT